MNETIWAILSEWNMINIEVKALVSSGPRGMSGELKKSYTTNKMANKPRVSEGVCPPFMG